MRSNTISILFKYELYIFVRETIYFEKILAKCSPKCTKLHHFKNCFRGSMPPNPPNKRVPTFQTYFEPPPPPEMKSQIRHCVPTFGVDVTVANPWGGTQLAQTQKRLPPPWQILHMPMDDIRWAMITALYMRR